METTSINDVWQLVAARLGASGHVRFDRAARGVTASPRTFVIEPRREVIVVLPHAVDTPATRFAVLHELGHAYLALTLPGGVPRVVDEAAAAYLGRLSEPPSWLPAKWLSPLAEAARHRRLAIARTLDVLERRLPELGDLPGAAPPWALWYDPGSQASYVAAEAIVDRIVAELGPNPPRGQVLRALTAERDRIDDRIQL